MGAVKGSLAFGDKPIISGVHGAVVLTFALAALTADIEAGTIMAKNGGGDIVEFDRSGATPVNIPVGVLTQKVGENDETCNLVVHGTVVDSSLLHKGSAASTADKTALNAIGIYAV